MGDSSCQSQDVTPRTPTSKQPKISHYSTNDENVQSTVQQLSSSSLLSRSSSFFQRSARVLTGQEDTVLKKSIRSSMTLGSGSLTSREEVDSVSPWACRYWVIHPESNFRFRWTIALAVTLLYIAIVVPLQMGFRVEATGLWRIWEYLVDIFFIFDLGINFLTGYVTEDGSVEMEPRKVARNYVLSIWFPIDLATSIPFDWVQDSLSGDLEHLKLAKIFRALKAMKVLRINRLLRGSVLEHIEDVVMQSHTMRFSLKMGKLLIAIHTLGMLFAFHWFACIMHMTADPTGDSWIRDYLSAYGDADVSGNTDDISFSTRYLLSVYWTCTTMSTVGYGDIVPNTNLERSVAFLMMIVGGSLYGFLIGNMNSIVHDVDANTRQYNRRMESILSYMNSRRFPKELQRKVIRFYRRYFKSRSALDEKTVLAELSSKLKTEVAHFLIDGLVYKNAIFKGLPPTQLAVLTTVLKPVFFEADDFMVKINDPIADIYIIAAGTAQAFCDDETVQPDVLGHGDSFGEEAITETGQQKLVWQVSVIATSVCETMLVPVKDLRAAFAQSKGALEAVRKHAQHVQFLNERMRLKKLQHLENSEETPKHSSPKRMLNKFRQVVNRQIVVGKLGDATIELQEGETPTELLRRTLELKAKDMERNRKQDRPKANALGHHAQKEMQNECTSQLSEMKNQILSLKTHQQTLERKLDQVLESLGALNRTVAAQS